MAITTAEDLFALLEKSELLSPEQLAKARRLVASQPDARTAAKLLAREEYISRWQAGSLLEGRTSFYLGKYRLLDLLGRGGMGSVFLAEHVTMNRRVAIKVVSRKIGGDRASLDRFFAEARAIAALDNPNIVRAYDFDNFGDRYYMVMEYVDGQDLQRMVEAEGPLDLELAADYIRQAADGLAHAHDAGMIHCDIKPSNLLVTQLGVVKILDMGLARLVGKETASSQSDQRVLGSVDYLAPEQALEGPNFDHRADIYSLGCTLYFLLSGHPPFPEGELTERIMKHQAEEPRPIREIRPEVPGDLAAICQRMMAKRPEDRFQSAAEISQLLADWRPPPRQLKRAVPIRPSDTPGDDLLNGDSSVVQWLDSLLTSKPATSGAMKVVRSPLATADEATEAVSAPVNRPMGSGDTPRPSRTRPNTIVRVNRGRTPLWRTALGYLNTPRRQLVAAGIAAFGVLLMIATLVAGIWLLQPKPTPPPTKPAPQKNAGGSELHPPSKPPRQGGKSPSKSQQEKRGKSPGKSRS
jgi:serine/threonine protein kinase